MSRAWTSWRIQAAVVKKSVGVKESSRCADFAAGQVMEMAGLKVGRRCWMRVAMDKPCSSRVASARYCEYIRAGLPLSKAVCGGESERFTSIEQKGVIGVYMGVP